LITTARDDGIELTEHELTAFLDEELADRDKNEPSYSWVHLALFRQFEAANRCRTWHSRSDLRSAVSSVSLDTPERWNVDLDDHS